jgi:hypothetical protein
MCLLLEPLPLELSIAALGGLGAPEVVLLGACGIEVARSIGGGVYVMTAIGLRILYL